MTKMMVEEELLEVAGGVDPEAKAEAALGYIVTCSCGYCKHCKSFNEAAAALLNHVGINKNHNCRINIE